MKGGGQLPPFALSQNPPLGIPVEQVRIFPKKIMWKPFLASHVTPSTKFRSCLDLQTRTFDYYMEEQQEDSMKFHGDC